MTSDIVYGEIDLLPVIVQLDERGVGIEMAKGNPAWRRVPFCLFWTLGGLRRCSSFRIPRELSRIAKGKTLTGDDSLLSYLLDIEYTH